MTMKLNLVTGLGETWELNRQLLDANGTPVNLTGHEVKVVVSKGRNNEVGSYTAVVDSQGHIAIKVADEVTAVWPVGKLSYVLIHLQPNGDERWMHYGALTVIDGGQA